MFSTQATDNITEVDDVVLVPRQRIDTSRMRVAIIHYWLVGMRGGERVLERMLKLFPRADIYTHVYDPTSVSQEIRDRVVKTSFIQRLPGAVKHYQSYLPLMPLALEQLDLRGYDLVISSESGPAKGVITAPGAAHVCYCHSPMRYLWDHYHEYLDTAGTMSKLVMPTVFHGLRQWDVCSASRIDHIVANSNFIRQRVKRAWNREASVVHPPVAVEKYGVADWVGDHYLWVSQIRPYKRPRLAVEAFNRLKLPLLIVGDGPELKELQKIAKPNIRFRKRLKFEELRHAYATARALVFTAEEDFGIVPVEANASGRPVIAFGKGGVTDSVIPGKTGIFFKEQTVDSLCDAVERFERWLPDFDPKAALANAGRFSPPHFDAGILKAVECALAS
jgi:glycosyltransferase involved in cell wall biosynthesis